MRLNLYLKHTTRRGLFFMMICDMIENVFDHIFLIQDESFEVEVLNFEIPIPKISQSNSFSPERRIQFFSFSCATKLFRCDSFWAHFSELFLLSTNSNWKYFKLLLIDTHEFQNMWSLHKKESLLLRSDTTIPPWYWQGFSQQG